MIRFAWLLPLALVACDIDQTREGEMPEVRVEDEGQLPAYDVDAEVPEVDMEMEKRNVELPEVDVTTEQKEVEVPTFEVNPDDGEAE